MIETWRLPPSPRTITAIEAHAAGEPLRVIVDGMPAIPGDTMLAKRRHAREHMDHLRTGLMWEPRGHADMYGAVITDPVTPDGDLGVLFLHNEGFSTMCGHGVIALTTVVLETGIVVKSEGDPEIRIDTPAGRVTSKARIENGRIASVTFRNVPSFAFLLDRQIEVPGLGTIRFDIAFGGAFYAFVGAADAGLTLDGNHFRELIDAGKRVKRAVAASVDVEHPDGTDLGFLYGTIFVGEAGNPSRHSRNVCVFADGEVDRSPTGTGVSARAALLSARGELGHGETITVESILGTCFDVRVVGTTRAGSHAAVIPEVTGSAHITGESRWVFDPRDPLREGFILR